MTFRGTEAGVTWWLVASERAKSVSVNGRESGRIWYGIKVKYKELGGCVENIKHSFKNNVGS